MSDSFQVAHLINLHKFSDTPDGSGEMLGVVQSLVTRPVSPTLFQQAIAQEHPLLAVNWTELSLTSSSLPSARLAILGNSHLDPNLDATDLLFERYTDLSSLLAKLADGQTPPDVVLVPCCRRAVSPTANDVVNAAHDATGQALALLRRWLTQERLASSRLILLTQRAVPTRHDEDVIDLPHAPLWGLVRSAQTEHPDRPILLLDIDDTLSSLRAIPFALACPDHQLALRDGKLLSPKLARLDARAALVAPGAPAWRLDISAKGTLENLALVPHPDALEPLADGQIRVAVRAAGLNFRDVLDALGMYPGDAEPLGAEGAGVVLEIGSGVTRLRPGDRVMGLFRAGFGPICVTDHRCVIPLPDGWTFLQAAAVPIVFLTAYYALLDLGHLQTGQKLLVHSATGGVGTAAVQLARHLGAEIFATASAPKQHALQSVGFDQEHLASSRSLEFEPHFLRATDGHGMDVVLNSLTQQFVDASLRLLPRGGHFVEMGKTDVRAPETIAADHPGVVYRAFDLLHAGPERIEQMLAELVGLFERGVLRPPPITPYDIRRAPNAFRVLAQANHIGKIVLTLPRPLEPEGTVLLTGGTGTLGSTLARHLVQKYNVKHLLLVSRRGLEAPGALALQQSLTRDGAAVTISACDASDPLALQRLLATIPAEHPLTAVVHAAGTLDDGLLVSLNDNRLHAVMRAKVDAAWNLHQLTAHLDLAAFILFSSVSGILGSPGQANYAAANAFLDALAHHRSATGLHALALQWGYWEERSAMTAHLSDADLRRMTRGGLLPLSSQQALALFDLALLRPDPALVAARFDLDSLAKSDALPGILRRLAVPKISPPLASNAHSTASLQQRLQSLPTEGRLRAVLDLVRSEISTVLGLRPSDVLDIQRPLRELGLDSLMALELRNRLSKASGLRLQTTLLFDYPTPAKLVEFIDSKIVPTPPANPSPIASDTEIRNALATISLDRLKKAGLIDTLMRLAARPDSVAPSEGAIDAIDAMSVNELIALALKKSPPPDQPTSRNEL